MLTEEMKTIQEIVPAPVFSFGRRLLLGVGQVMFQESPLSGLIFLVGIFSFSGLLGLATLAATAVSTLSAQAMGAPREALDAGLYGFNGALVGIALFVFIPASPMLWVYLALAAVSSSVLMAALSRLGQTWGLSALTAPFVLTTWIFIWAASHLSHVQIFRLPAETAMEGLRLDVTWFEASLRGVGQVFLLGDWLAGAIFLVALAVNSRRAALLAWLGSLIGLGTGMLFGAPPIFTAQGLYGFNGCLTAIALLGLSPRLRDRDLMWGVLGVVVATVLGPAVGTFLAPSGVVGLTAPFVLTVWIFNLARAQWEPPAQQEAQRV